MNEEKKLKYGLWIGILALLTAVVTQWKSIFPEKKEPVIEQVQPTPTINIENKITNSNDNSTEIHPQQDYSKTKPITAQKANKDYSLIVEEKKIEGITPTIKDRRAEIYTSRVVDNSGNGISNVKVYCPNCLNQIVYTDEHGTFVLECKFSGTEAFWKSTLTFSQNNNKHEETIDWRDKSPQSIKF